MRFFVLVGAFALVGTPFMLTSCATVRTNDLTPQKTFQYSYQAPSRVLATSGFAQQLSSGQTGSTIKIKLQNNAITTVKLGRNYFSASGHNCRKYTVQSNYEYTACKISGRWHEASPIIISK